MTEVSEEGSLRSEFPYEGESLVKGIMRLMGSDPEGSNHQEIQVSEEGAGSNPQIVHVGEVSRPAPPFGEEPSEYIQASMLGGDGRSDDISYPSGLGIRNRDEVEPGFPAPLLSLSERIDKALLDLGYGRLVSVDAQGLGDGERPEIVHAVDVVCMRMGEQYRVQSGYARPNGLEAEFRTRVHEYPLSSCPGDEE